MRPKQKTAKQPNNKGFTKLKLKFLVAGKILILLAVVVFLFRWQILEHERFQAQASSRVIKSEVSALRGDILAKDGSVLSYSEPRFDIYVYKNQTHGLVAAENAGRQTREEFIRKVSSILDVEPSTLTELLTEDTQWIKIASKVTKETRDDLLSIPTDRDPEVTLDGLDYLDTSVRIYPEEHLASHVVGFIGQDDFGNESGATGLELYFDGLLKPQAGISTLETDSNQNIIAISDNEIRDARRGATIHTTIDKNIQAKVERILKQGVERYMAKSGTAIIVDPRTGEIIAMANYPSYDPNTYSEEEDSRIFGNIAVTNPYEIGSVGKIFTMAAAVDQDEVMPGTVVIDGHDGCQEIIDQKVVCTYDKKPQGPLTATEAMIKSDNLALFATADLIGSQKLADYLESFGMGSKTNIQLAGEDSGYLKPGERWNEADLATFSYGHSYFQTPLQSVMGVSALANGGKRMEPMIVTKIADSNGKTRVYQPRAVEQVVTPESTEIMDQILYEVFKHNLYEDKYKYLADYNIAMKSGTALIPYTALAPPVDKPGYSNEVNSTYVGYDASEQNKFVMLVNLSEPQTRPKLSYNNARLLWLDMFIEVKDDLAVPKID